MLVTRQKTSRITLIFACLLGMTISVVQCQAFANRTYSCNFEVERECQWSQDHVSDHLNWIRKQGHIRVPEGIIYEGPFVDHTMGLGVLKSKTQGPGALQFRGGKCIHISHGGFTKPNDGQRLVIHRVCNEERLQFELGLKGVLKHTKHNMCVKPIKPVFDGVEVGLYRNCTKTDKWSWTKSGSLQYQKKMCLTAKNGVHHVDGEILVLSSVCDQLQNFIKFVPIGLGWYLYMENSRSSKRKDSESARFISPKITKVKSCLQFYYRMFGQPAGSVQVYVLSEGSMGFPVKSFYGPRCRDWHQAQVAVNDQTTPYQYVIEGVRGVNDVGNIAIDDISVRDSCSEPEHPPTSSISQLNATTHRSFEVFNKPDISSNVSIIIAVNSCALLLLVVINIFVLLKCRRRNQKPKLSTPDPGNIALTVDKSLQEPSRGIEESVLERSDSYVIPAEKETNTYEEVKDALNSDYTQLDQSKCRDETDDGQYQKLLKRI
ncbi:MAM and LDL-receptor class A domain-containing protein 1-like [Dendronephthya gigantea]|uniref:MAM and LDL-receptor class A domain-containing protein 1-like n=1 Tax=Dendronephthya gigantea TaxID=151771 RepID=UPI00106A359B|nr:MAM and LDL-receptor class A domain-containing protein 1-like [Dendronephthya gigantea]